MRSIYTQVYSIEKKVAGMADRWKHGYVGSDVDTWAAVRRAPNEYISMHVSGRFLIRQIQMLLMKMTQKTLVHVAI